MISLAIGAISTYKFLKDAERVRAIFLVSSKNFLALINIKMHFKSCYYQYKLLMSTIVVGPISHH